METHQIPSTGTTLPDAHDPHWSLDAVAVRHRKAAHAEELAAQLQLADRFGAEMAARYVAVDAAVSAAEALDVPDNTTDARMQARRTWERFCGQTGIPTGVVVGRLLDFYALWLLDRGAADGKPLAYSSAGTYLKNTLTVLRTSGVELPENAGPSALSRLKEAHKQLKRVNRHAEGRGQADAISWLDLTRAVDACDTTTLAGLRDRAALLVGWLLMARSSELAALHVGDVKWLRGGRFVAVTVRASKTDGSARTNEADCQDDAYCVVTAVRECLDALAAALGLGHRDELPKDSPLFRQVGTGGRLIRRRGFPDGAGLSPDAMTSLIAAAADRATLAYRVTGHSLRSGGATDALANGTALHLVAKLGGWSPNSTELAGYLRDSRDLDQRASVRRMRRTTARAA